MPRLRMVNSFDQLITSTCPQVLDFQRVSIQRMTVFLRVELRSICLNRGLRCLHELLEPVHICTAIDSMVVHEATGGIHSIY